MEKGTASTEKPDTRVYFQRSTANQELDLDGTAGLTETAFDVEVAAYSEATSQVMTAQLKSGVSVVLTTLNGGINASVTSVTVASAANIPDDGLPFIITVDSEKMAITSVSGTTLTVSRGYASTTPASHSSGANVTVSGLNGYRGAMGNSTVLGMFVEDHSDDYVPLLLDADEGYFVSTFRAVAISQ